MSNDFQDSLECKICYDNFDELAHRPLTLVCENETCGHTYCAACIKELTRRVCPACNAQFRHTTTNWFVIGLLRNPNGSSINTAFVTKLKDELDNLKLNDKELNKILVKILAENNVYYQDVKQKIDTKVLEASAQLKSIQESLLDEFLCLKTSYEKVLNENRLFEAEVQERIRVWTKQLNSGEFKSSSEKLNRINVEIEIYMRTLDEKKSAILNYKKFSDICYFEERYFKLDKKLLGEIRKTIDECNQKLVRFKFLIGFKMFLNGFLHFLYSLGYFFLGLWYLITGLLILLIGCFKNSKINFNFNEELFKRRIRTIVNLLMTSTSSIHHNSKSQKNQLQQQQQQPLLQIQYNESTSSDNDLIVDDCMMEEESEVIIEYVDDIVHHSHED